MTSTVQPFIADVQSRADGRGIAIDQVGISDLRYPIVVMDRRDGQQHVTATIQMSVRLPHQFKGTHMSRFVEVLNRHRGELTLRTMPAVLRELQSRLEAPFAEIEVKFTYFLERSAPVTGATGLMDYACTFRGSIEGKHDSFVLGVDVPVASLCPCSKEISDYGAHNQRGHIQIEIRSSRGSDGQPQIVWIEELVELAEGCASAPVYSLLKRADERHVTMQAYDNPAFVEDIVRAVAGRLMADVRLDWFCVHVLNLESIHNHNAFARIEWRRS